MEDFTKDTFSYTNNRINLPVPTRRFLTVNKENVKLFYEEFAYYQDIISDHRFWHKIVVENVENLDKFKLLKVFIDFMKPLDFMPHQYETVFNGASFLVKQCTFAIKKLFASNLVIPNPYNEFPFTVKVNLRHAHLSELNYKDLIQKNYQTVLAKRYDAHKCVLDLSHLHEDKDLEEYCPLFLPKVLNFVLKLSKKYKISYLNLSGNYIDDLTALQFLGNNFISINLSENMINEMDKLKPLTFLSNLKYLNIDRNPICEGYRADVYVKHIISMFPKLTKLDDVTVTGDLEKNISSINYINSSEGYRFVNHFLEHYYTEFDSALKTNLEQFYDENALYSVNLQNINSTIAEYLGKTDYRLKDALCLFLTDFENDNHFSTAFSHNIQYGKIPKPNSRHLKLSYEDVKSDEPSTSKQTEPPVKKKKKNRTQVV